MQRFGSSLNLNVHFHALVADGVFATEPDGSLLFHPLPAPSDEDIARLARAVCRKVTRYLKRLTPPGPPATDTVGSEAGGAEKAGERESREIKW